MRKKVMVLLMIASLAGGALGFNPPPEGKRMNPEKMFEKMAKEVGLTGQQKDKFTAAAKQIEQEARIMRKKNRELFGKVEEEIQNLESENTILRVEIAKKSSLVSLSKKAAEDGFKKPSLVITP